MLGDLFLPRMVRNGSLQIAVILSRTLIQQGSWRGFGYHRGLSLSTMNRNLVWTCIVWLDRQGCFQKLGPGIIVGNQFLEHQHEVGDVLSFNNCLQAKQRRFELHCIDILMADIASDLSVRGWNQMLIIQIQFFEHFLTWTKTGKLNLDVSFRLEPREQN